MLTKIQENPREIPMKSPCLDMFCHQIYYTYPWHPLVVSGSSSVSWAPSRNGRSRCRRGAAAPRHAARLAVAVLAVAEAAATHVAAADVEQHATAGWGIFGGMAQH